MSEFIAQIKAQLDVGEAEKKMNDFTKKEHEVKIKTEIDEKSTQKGINETLKQTQKQTKKNPLEVEVNYKEGKHSLIQLADSANRLFSMFSGVNAMDFGTDKIRDAIGELKEMDSILTEISKTSDSTESELKALGNEAFDIASEYGRKAADFLTAVQEMNRSGFYGKQGEAMAELSMLGQAAGNMSSDVSNSYLLATNAAYDYAGSIDKLSTVLDGQNMITNRNSVAMLDMAQATSKAASMAAQTGVEVDELSAIIGTATARTKQSGNVIGTSLKSLFVNLQDTSNEKIVNTFTELGISQTKFINGSEQLKTPIELLKELATAYNNLPEGSTLKADVLRNIGQKRQANVLAAILGGMSSGDYDKMLTDFAQGEGSAMVESAKSVDNLEGRLNKLNNTFTEFVSNFAQTDTMKGGISFLDGTISALDKLQDAQLFIPSMISAVMGLQNLFTGKGIKDISFDKDGKGLDKLNIEGNLFGIVDFTKMNKWKNHFKDAEVELENWNSSCLDGQTSVKKFNSAFKDDNKDFKNYISTVKDGSASIEGYKEHLRSAGVEFEQFGGNMKSVLANMATGFLASAGIELAIAGITTFIDQVIHKQDRLIEKAGESKSVYSSTVSELQSINSELEVTQAKINELKSKGKLLPDERAELAQLEEQNSLLETQLGIKEDLANTQMELAAKAAKESIDYKSEKVMRRDKDGNYAFNEDGSAAFDMVDRKEYVRQQIAEMEKAQAQIDEAQEKLANKKLSKKERDSYTRQFETATGLLENYKKEASDTIAELNEEAKGFYDEQTGMIISGFENDISEINKLNHEFNSFGLTGIEKIVNAINSFFDGSAKSNTIKDSITDMLNSGEVDNATDALHKMGLTLNDLGVTGEGKKAAFDDYFSGLISSAKEAEAAIKSIDGSVEGVKSAFESENQDADWNSMSDYLKQAQELYKNGKVGTDDFKAAAQFMSPDIINPDSTKYDADAYVAAWEAAQNKIKRYFDSENPINSVTNFANDLVTKGLASKVNDEYNWSDTFTSSAKAAKELGLSIQATEALMHNLESYGFEFDDVMFSGEGLTRYQSALEQIKTIYDEMDNGSKGKERLKNIIDQSELDDFGNNLENLTEDKIIKIEFEYDLATIQQQIDDLKNGISDSGGSTTDYAELISYQRKQRDMLAGQEGMSDAVDDSGYASSLSAFDSLAQRLISEYDTLGEAGRRSIQQQQSALLDLQTSYLDMFQSGKVADWSSFLGTEEAGSIIEKLATDTNQSVEAVKSELAELMNIDVEDIEVNVKANDNASNTITSVLSQLMGMPEEKVAELIAEDNASDAVISFLSSLSGIPEETLTSINATDGASGVVTYVLSQILGIPEEKVTELLATEKVSNIAAMATSAVNKVPTSHDTKINATDNATPKANTAKSAINSIPSSKHVTITGSLSSTFTSAAATARSVIASVNGGGSKLNGTAHVDGTVKGLYPIPKLSGRALVMGTLEDESWLKPQWKTKKDDVALTGEVGQEMVVKGNRWWTVGDNGAEFSAIPQGSIVFDAKQTKELLKNGFTNSRGTAHLSGTAYANGGRLPASKSSSYSSKVNTKKTTSSANNAANAVSSAAQATSDALDALTDYFDWVIVNMSRAARLSEIAENAIDTAIGLSAKQSNTEEAIRKVQNEIDIARQGADKYLSHANWFAGQSGLSADLQNRVQNGTIDISKYDDDTKKKIEEYQDWYEKYLDAFDKVTELQEKETELAIKRLENIEDFYKLVVNVHESLQDANDSALELNDALGFSAVSNSVKKLIQSSISEAESIYEQKLQQLSDYENEFNNLMSQGYIKEGSDEYYEAKAQLNEFRQSVYDAEVSLIEFSDKLREVEYTKIQQLIDGFERAVDKLDARIDLMESRDETVPESIYQKQIDANNSRISANRKMRNAKLSEQALYAVNSTRYQELAEEINKLDTETLGLMEDNEKLKDTIFELRFTPLEDGIKKMESLRSELKDFMDLLNEDAYFDKQGRITEEGVAALALLEQSMSSAKQEIADYREGLDKLQKSFDNGVISEAEFNEKSEEYRKGIRDSIKDVQDYSESLTKLYLNQMKQESEYIQEIIDKRKKALKAKEEYYDYDRKITSKNKDINMLKSQIAALEGVNNASAQAELKKLKQELADAEDDLAETKREHAVDMQEQGYDAMSDELNEILKNTEYEIIHNSEKQQSVIQSMLQNVVNMYSSAYGKINEIIHNTGWVGSTDFNSNQSNLSTSSGANSQVSNATQHQSNVGSTSTAQSTVTSPINNNDSFNQKFEQEIYQDANTTNRPVAELKMSAKSVTLEEGQSTSVSVQIRPTDAKNKKLTWKTSNKSIATISNGTIKAIKPGSCQITASTTDGSGISASVGVTVTKKPEPPKPAPSQQQTSTNSSNGGGDGVPRVGDAVTFASGRYYYDSEGVNPSGNQMLGQTVYITKINSASWATKPYHISCGSSLGSSDLGWVTLDQLKGYNSGARKLPKDELALFDEDKNGKSDPGSEVIITKYGTLKQFDAGDTIFSNEQVKRLWNASKGDEIPFKPEAFYRPENIFDKILQQIAVPNNVNDSHNVDVHIDKLLTIEGGTITKDSIPDIKKAIKDSIPMITDGVSDHLYKNGIKAGIRRKW